MPPRTQSPANRASPPHHHPPSFGSSIIPPQIAIRPDSLPSRPSYLLIIKTGITRRFDFGTSSGKKFPKPLPPRAPNAPVLCTPKSPIADGIMHILCNQSLLSRIPPSLPPCSLPSFLPPLPPSLPVENPFPLPLPIPLRTSHSLPRPLPLPASPSPLP